MSSSNYSDTVAAQSIGQFGVQIHRHIKTRNLSKTVPLKPPMPLMAIVIDQQFMPTINKHRQMPKDKGYKADGSGFKWVFCTNQELLRIFQPHHLLRFFTLFKEITMTVALQRKLQKITIAKHYDLELILPEMIHYIRTEKTECIVEIMACDNMLIGHNKYNAKYKKQFKSQVGAQISCIKIDVTISGQSLSDIICVRDGVTQNSMTEFLPNCDENHFLQEMMKHPLHTGIFENKSDSESSENNISILELHRRNNILKNKEHTESKSESQSESESESETKLDKICILCGNPDPPQIIRLDSNIEWRNCYYCSEWVHVSCGGYQKRKRYKCDHC